MKDPHTNSILEELFVERCKQDAKWGEQNHDFGTWLAIITEELGEASREWLHATLECSPGEELGHRRNLREELVQVVAVGVAILECGDRRGWFQVGDDKTAETCRAKFSHEMQHPRPTKE